MTIDPRIGMWVSIVAALLSFIAVSTAQLTTIFDAHIANQITAVAAFVGGGINAVNAILHMIPSPPGQTGAKEFPLGPKAAP